MNLPNKLSLLRVALIPVMVALMLPQTLVCDLLAAAVFAVAALTDYFDGHIARSRQPISASLSTPSRTSCSTSPP